MKWEIIRETSQEGETPARRTYQNDHTGTTCEVELIYTDADGRKWWGFTNLLNIPYIRFSFTKAISDLFQTALSKADIDTWIKEQKALLKSNDAERYEKLYALLLEKETAINSVVDPLQQQLALATVYIMEDEENIGYFSHEEATRKMAQWRQYPESIAFFLQWHTDQIQRSLQPLETISLIASTGESLLEKKTPSVSGTLF
jgi:hypothetical protein